MELGGRICLYGASPVEVAFGTFLEEQTGNGEAEKKETPSPLGMVASVNPKG